MLSPPNNHDTFIEYWCLRLSYFNPTRKNKVIHTSVSLCWTVPWFGSQNIAEVVETSGKVKRVTNLNNKGSDNKNPFKQTGSVYTVKLFPLETHTIRCHTQCWPPRNTQTTSTTLWYTTLPTEGRGRWQEERTQKYKHDQPREAETSLAPKYDSVCVWDSSVQGTRESI